MVPTGFDTIDEAGWREAAVAGLKGKPFAALEGKTPEGIAVEPLYLERHRPAAAAAAPALPARSLIAQHVDATAGAAANATVRAAAGAGVDVLWLGVEEVGALAAAISGLPTNQPILLDAGTRATSLAEKALDLGYTQVSAMFDPFGAALRRWGLDISLEAALDQAGTFVRDAAALTALGEARGSAPFHPRALAFSAADVIDAGGTASQAIGYVLAACIDVMRRLEIRGLSPAQAAAEMALVVAPGTDVFYGVATLRALRVAWSKVLVAAGAPDAPTPLVVGTTSRRSLSRLDPPTNMLRASVETFALLVGGADVVAPRAFDEATRGSSELGRRLAKNTAIVLQEESHLSVVPDPALGSFYIESLTDALARAGWEEMRQIEQEGGLIASLAAGQVQRRVHEARLAREKEVVERRRVLVGVNDFPTADPPAPDQHPEEEAESTRTWPIRALDAPRDAEPFEALRARVASLPSRPRVALACVGDPAKARARAAFARGFFEVAGLQLQAASDEVGAAEIVVVAGTDDAYAAEGVAAVAAAKAAGARAIVLAGRPGELEPALRAAGLTDAIYLGADVPAVAGAILDRLARAR
ncbi:MAG: hypothetical protein IPG04_18600 [Polyangiaceae bacterium]|jgi:methylmalonyl-CoA mutase|nr:hypothetical protein [Polyangiaceae bacterium]